MYADLQEHILFSQFTKFPEDFIIAEMFLDQKPTCTITDATPRSVTDPDTQPLDTEDYTQSPSPGDHSRATEESARPSTAGVAQTSTIAHPSPQETTRPTASEEPTQSTATEEAAQLPTPNVPTQPPTQEPTPTSTGMEALQPSTLADVACTPGKTVVTEPTKSPISEKTAYHPTPQTPMPAQLPTSDNAAQLPLQGAAEKSLWKKSPQPSISKVAQPFTSKETTQLSTSEESALKANHSTMLVDLSDSVPMKQPTEQPTELAIPRPSRETDALLLTQQGHSVSARTT